MNAELEALEELSRKERNCHNPNNAKKVCVKDEFCSCGFVFGENTFLHVSDESISKEGQSQQCNTGEIDTETKEAVSENGRSGTNNSSSSRGS